MMGIRVPKLVNSRNQVQCRSLLGAGHLPDFINLSCFIECFPVWCDCASVAFSTTYTQHHSIGTPWVGVIKQAILTVPLSNANGMGDQHLAFNGFCLLVLLQVTAFF